jgi:hypothetical protein
MAEYTPAQIRTGNRRLLKLADILDVADALHRKRGEPGYDQGREEHDCGTPACAWGHYAYSTAARRKKFVRLIPYAGVESANYNDSMTEFSLSVAEKNEVFGIDGCDSASTAAQAAAYIRDFVRARAALASATPKAVRA